MATGLRRHDSGRTSEIRFRQVRAHLPAPPSSSTGFLIQPWPRNLSYSLRLQLFVHFPMAQNSKNKDTKSSRPAARPSGCESRWTRPRSPKNRVKHTIEAETSLTYLPEHPRAACPSRVCFAQTPLANPQATLTADLNRIWACGLLRPRTYCAPAQGPCRRQVRIRGHRSVIALRPLSLQANVPQAHPCGRRRLPYGGHLGAGPDERGPSSSRTAGTACAAISTVALAKLTEQTKSQRRPVEAGRVLDNLGAMICACHTEGLDTCLSTLLNAF
ncbi:hypothetical protein B0H15DRAFT_511053 [Mycena belliarum]|uniref:Uncharacterized protein n=1 Tax=Mycena belliarum TaxID=1033014 RepID=A0AAD6UDU5_9AGAR|nr:hypothetical protein B0H15DRAFT_511053 [Mycena belliae]